VQGLQGWLPWLIPGPIFALWEVIFRFFRGELIQTSLFLLDNLTVLPHAEKSTVEGIQISPEALGYGFWGHCTVLCKKSQNGPALFTHRNLFRGAKDRPNPVFQLHGDFLGFDVSSCNVKDCACLAFSGIKHPNGVGRAGDPSCSGHAVKGIVGGLFPNVMDDKKGKTTINSEGLKLSGELVVIEKLVIVPFSAGKNPSKGVDNDQVGFRVLVEPS